jgi:hypothetical protein
MSIKVFSMGMTDISITMINSIVSDAKYMNEFAFLGTSSKPCLATDDPLYKSCPPEVSLVDPVDDEYPPDHSG